MLLVLENQFCNSQLYKLNNGPDLIMQSRELQPRSPVFLHCHELNRAVSIIPPLQSPVSRSKIVAGELKGGKMVQQYHNFHTFGDPGNPVSVNGAFRDNVRVFLQQCGERVDCNVEGLSIWCTFLVHETGGLVIPLYTIEEDVKLSLEPFCDHCRCAGWSHHYLSRRKYHFIIPDDDGWKKPLTTDVLDIETHLLHGLIHCNGCGHLLCINGIEGGSKKLCGRETMDLWDRICGCLCASKITVRDVSKKHKMDLRLLHGIAYGQPWFGRWGYRFLCGSFGVKYHHYDRALEILSSLELDQLIQDFGYSKRYSEVKDLISFYRESSETSLNTLRDLLRFMLTLKLKSGGRRNVANSNSKARFGSSKSVSRSSPEKSVKCRKFSNLAPNWDSRWPVKRLEFTASVIVEALRMNQAEMKFNGSFLSRQEVRDAARQQIGDTGLIDYVLKSLNNVIVGDYIVRRMVNKHTRKLEYMISEVKKDGAKADSENIPHVNVPYPTARDDIDADFSYLYNDILLAYSGSDSMKGAARTVLNSKYFAKEWPFRDEHEHTLRYSCQLHPSLIETDCEISRDFPIGECIAVPLYSTIRDLKEVIQNAMRDTYCIMECFVVTDIVGTEGMGDETLLFDVLESGLGLWVGGFGLDLASGLRYEGGEDDWKVRCKCGAQDDDGERMIACDKCEVWQHTYCCGIKESEPEPSVFICENCYSKLGSFDFHVQPTYDYGMDMEMESCIGLLMPNMASEIYYPDSCLLSLESTPEIF